MIKFGDFNMPICTPLFVPLLYFILWVGMSNVGSVTRKKLPNVYNRCPKMISLEK